MHIFNPVHHQSGWVNDIRIFKYRINPIYSTDQMLREVKQHLNLQAPAETNIWPTPTHSFKEDSHQIFQLVPAGFYKEWHQRGSIQQCASDLSKSYFFLNKMD